MKKNAALKKSRLFGLGVIQAAEYLPTDRTVDVIYTQLLRSASLVGSKYRAATNAMSKKEAIAQLRIAREKSDECLYLMELLVDSKSVDMAILASLMNEAELLFQIFNKEIHALRPRTRKTKKSS